MDMEQLDGSNSDVAFGAPGGFANSHGKGRQALEVKIVHQDFKKGTHSLLKASANAPCLLLSFLTRSQILATIATMMTNKCSFVFKVDFL